MVNPLVLKLASLDMEKTWKENAEHRAILPIVFVFAARRHGKELAFSIKLKRVAAA